MRVAIDASALGSDRGGDETLLRGMISGLRAVAPSEDVFDLFVRRGARLPAEVLDDERFVAHPLRASGGAVRLTAELPLALRSRRPDVCLAFTHSPVGVRVPTALVVTDLSFRHRPDFYPLHARIRLNVIVPRQAQRSSAVVTLTEFGKEDLVESYSLDPRRVFVVPCAVDLPAEGEVWRAEGDWARSRGVREPFVLYLGNLHPRKNVPRLIDAFRAALQRFGLPAGCQLVIAGRTWWGDGPELAMSRQTGNVVVLGGVSEARREWLLRSASCMAYVSLFEGFGLPPLEAMIRGTPVVVSSVTSLPEVVGDAALLVDPTDPDAIARALVRVVTDEGLRSDLARRGEDRARSFGAVRTGTAVLEVLRSVAHRPTRVAPTGR